MLQNILTAHKVRSKRISFSGGGTKWGMELHHIRWSYHTVFQPGFHLGGSTVPQYTISRDVSMKENGLRFVIMFIIRSFIPRTANAKTSDAKPLP